MDTGGYWSQLPDVGGKLLSSSWGYLYRRDDVELDKWTTLMERRKDTSFVKGPGKLKVGPFPVNCETSYGYFRLLHTGRNALGYHLRWLKLSFMGTDLELNMAFVIVQPVIS